MRPHRSVFSTILLLALGWPGMSAGAAWGQTSPYQSQSWTLEGPTPLYDNLNGNFGAVGGPVLAFAMAPNSSQTALAAAWDGGIWETLDAGADWTPITDSAATQAISALAFAPSNASTIYAGTGAPPLSASQPGIAGDGILASQNGGQSWTLEGQAVLAGFIITQIAVDPAQADHLLVSAVPVQGTSTGGLFESSDGGQSWTQLARGAVWSFAWQPASQQIAAGVAGVVEYSSQGGAFTAASGGLPTGFSRAAFTAEPANGNDIYALFANAQGGCAGLYFSGNGGASWSAVTLPANFINSIFETNSGGQGTGEYAMALAADPGNSSGLYAGGVDLWHSADGGASWTDLTNSSLGTASTMPARQHAVAFDANGNLWLGNDGGAWLSLNQGGSFINLNPTLWAEGIDAIAVEGNTLAAGTLEEGFLAGSPQTQWNVAAAAPAGNILNDASQQTLWAMGANAASLEVAVNGSLSFSPLYATTPNPGQDAAAAAFMPPLLGDSASPGTLFTGTDEIWESTNSGQSWNVLANPTQNTTITAMAWNGTQMLLGTATGEVMTSSDQGASWSSLGAGLTGDEITGIAAGTGSNVFAACEQINGNANSPCLYSWNGSSWSQTTGALPGGAIYAITADPLDANVIYAATTAGVYGTPDGGATWVELGTGLPKSQIRALRLRPARRLLLAGTAGRGLWSWPLETEARNAQAVSGGGQSGTVGMPLGSPLAAQIVNAFGYPVAGATVTWSDNGAGGKFAAGQTVTDAGGQTSNTYTLPNTAGALTLTASVPSGTAFSSASFSATAQAAAATQMLAYAGNQQSGTVHQPLPQPLVAMVEDSQGNPVGGYTVNFSDGGAGGGFSTAAATTYPNGQASVVYTLPATPGTVTVTATSASGETQLPAVTWSETANAAPGFALSLSPATQNVNWNSTATYTLTTQAIGGESQPIQLICTQPVTGCTVTQGTLTPGQTTTVSVATGSLATGSNVIGITGTIGSLQQTASAALVVTAPAVAMAATPTSATLAAGGAQTFIVSLTPSNGFTGTVTLSCAYGNNSMPYGMSCTPAPIPVNITGTNAGSATVSLTTLAASSGALPQIPYGKFPMWGGLILGIILLARRRKRGRRRWLAWGLLLPWLVILAGCGGAYYAPAPYTMPGTPAGTYALTLSATASDTAGANPVVITVAPVTLTVTVN